MHVNIFVRLTIEERQVGKTRGCACIVCHLYATWWLELNITPEGTGVHRQKVNDGVTEYPNSTTHWTYFLDFTYVS